MNQFDQGRLTRSQIKKALKDPEGSAEVVNLIYTTDKMPGIRRIMTNGKFFYKINGKKITDTSILLRIKNLAIPPAWENVWICNDENGHLQVTGYDRARRKQYRYHPSWNRVRKQTNFFRMLEFGKQLSCMRERIKEDLNRKGLPKEKVLATIISVLDSAALRIGNRVYAKLHGSYGITTLKDNHVKIDGNKVRFCFVGKKGVRQTATIKNKKLSSIIRRVRDLPGKHLFAYIDQDNELRRVDSGMVNEYIKEITKSNFTAKDFRTWVGSVAALKAFYSLGDYDTVSDCKRKINLMYDFVASDLLNTRSVVRNHYVHPLVVELYETKKLRNFFNSDITNEIYKPNNLKPAEEILINILENN